MRKAFRLTDEDEVKWSELKDRYKLSSDMDLLRYLITNHWYFAETSKKNNSEASPSIEEESVDEIRYTEVDPNELRKEKQDILDKAHGNIGTYLENPLLKEIVDKNPPKKEEFHVADNSFGIPVQEFPEGVDIDYSTDNIII